MAKLATDAVAFEALRLRFVFNMNSAVSSDGFTHTPTP